MICTLKVRLLPEEICLMIPGIESSDAMIRDFNDSHEHYNHGELYCAIRHYTQEDLDLIAESWKMKLSSHSRKNLRRLLLRESWTKAFDDILQIPGFRKYLSLSSMHHIMDTHGDEARTLTGYCAKLMTKIGDSPLSAPC